MSRGRELSTLAAILQYDPAKLTALAEHVRCSIPTAVTPSSLRGLVPDGREYLAFGCLSALGLLPISCPVDPSCSDLDGLVRDGNLIIEAFENKAEVSSGTLENIELAWTLPALLASSMDVESPAQSLAGLLRYGISRARRSLLMVSPFLEQQGLVILESALRGALDRGVEVTLISHGLQEEGTPGCKAHAYLMRSLPGIKCFSSPLPNSHVPYVLVHAKVLVADSNYAVLSSANLTQYGLATHLEIGVGVVGEIAARLTALFTEVIRVGLVAPVV